MPPTVDRDRGRADRDVLGARGLPVAGRFGGAAGGLEADVHDHHIAHVVDLIDHDDDGRVHANEVLAAIAWAGKLLRNPDLLVNGSGIIALADIDNSTEEGQQVLASAQYILSSLG